MFLIRSFSLIKNIFCLDLGVFRKSCLSDSAGASLAKSGGFSLHSKVSVYTI
ncbi:hypothetical protein LPE509_01250 [Legionella pneumophila subsp. pneumophila LPE509]|nr:hypothetical protein LPE509_01250 [Legionella pneumophila subsp. pneumophila LPE509]